MTVIKERGRRLIPSKETNVVLAALTLIVFLTLALVAAVAVVAHDLASEQQAA